jgi:predicted kinase
VTMSKAHLVLLAGPSCSGKSALADELHRTKGAEIVRAWELIAALAGNASTRAELQATGARVERETQGHWLAEAVALQLQSSAGHMVVVDSVRTSAQATLVRQLSEACKLVYLTADPKERDRRFRAGNERGYLDGPTLAAVEAHPTEQAAGELEAIADCVIDTTNLSMDDLYDAAAKCLN